MQLVRGKKKVKFFLWITMSPGSFPIKGILGKKYKKTPKRKIIIPMNIKNFPKNSNPILK